MANVNYAAVCTSDVGFSNINISQIESRSTSAVKLEFFRITNFTGGGVKVDPPGASVSIFED